MSALRKHQNTGTCLGLMALGKDFYIKKAVAKITGFLVPVFLQACSSACSELALEVGVTVHEVGCKHHMAACFSGKTLRYRIRGRVEEQHENILILNPAIHKRHSSHLLLDLLHKWFWIPRPQLGSLLAQAAWACQNGKKKNNSGLVGTVEWNCRQQTISLNIHGNSLGQHRRDVLVENPWCFGMPKWQLSPNSQEQVSPPVVCLEINWESVFWCQFLYVILLISFLLVFADSSRTAVAHEQTLLSARRSLPWFSLSEKWVPYV